MSEKKRGQEERGREEKEGRKKGRGVRREEQENLHIWLLCIRRLTCLWVIYNVYEAEDGPLR